MNRRIESVTTYNCPHVDPLELCESTLIDDSLNINVAIRKEINNGIVTVVWELNSMRLNLKEEEERNNTCHVDDG